MSDLFSYGYQQQVADNVPLAARMRPRTLDEFVGQKHIVGPGSLLRRAISADRLTSMIFYGPPGTGKTTLAAIIANQTRASFQKLNAVTAGVAQVREVAEEARRRLEMYRQATVLFIDEIHRFNKGQQDALLPAVEDGTVLLIGATTENPFFSINSALLSRCRLFELYPLTRGSQFHPGYRAEGWGARPGQAQNRPPARRPGTYPGHRRRRRPGRPQRPGAGRPDHASQRRGGNRHR